jgi:hypothetical protein
MDISNLIDLLPMAALFSSPKAPPPDPELERQRKEREEAAKQEKISLAKKEARGASEDLTRRRRGVMLSGYRGYQEPEDGTTLG